MKQKKKVTFETLHKPHLLWLGRNTFLFLLFILLNYLSQRYVKESRHLKETTRFCSSTIPKFRNPFKMDFPYNDLSHFV